MEPLSTDEELPFIRPEQESLAGTLPLELIEHIVRSGESAGFATGWEELNAESMGRNRWSMKMMGICSRWREVALGRGRYHVARKAKLEDLLAVIEGSVGIGTGMKELSIFSVLDRGVAVGKLLGKVRGLRSLRLVHVGFTTQSRGGWTDSIAAMARMSQMKSFEMYRCYPIPSNGLVALLKSWPRLKKLRLDTPIGADPPLFNIPILPASVLPPSLVELDVRVFPDIHRTLEYLATSTTGTIRRLKVISNVREFSAEVKTSLTASLQTLAAHTTSFHLERSDTAFSEIISAVLPSLAACTTIHWYAYSAELPLVPLVALPKLRHLLFDYPSPATLPSILKVIAARGSSGLRCVHVERTLLTPENVLDAIEAACDEAGVLFSEDIDCSHQ